MLGFLYFERNQDEDLTFLVASLMSATTDGRICMELFFSCKDILSTQGKMLRRCGFLLERMLPQRSE